MIRLTLGAIQTTFTTMFIGLGFCCSYGSTEYKSPLSRLILTGIVPVSFLLVANLLIYRKVRLNQQSRVRRKSSATQSAGNLAHILIVVGRNTLALEVIITFVVLVLVFLVSNVPRLLLNLAELTAVEGIPLVDY